jgi:hypothetical protein
MTPRSDEAVRDDGTTHPLRCRCGTVQGHVVRSFGSARAVCYCRDCQAYARFLGTPGVVDEHGGTEVIATLPADVHFTAGLEALACMSLSERGLLRWYASCCNTPLGNTPRNPALPYVGVPRSCLPGGQPALERSFGPRRMAVNTRSARTNIPSTPIASIIGVMRLMVSALGARLSGKHRQNPFFAPDTREPVRPVHVLSPRERAQAYGRVR